MATTALPQVINGILTAFNNSSALSGVRIFDGPEIDSSYPGDAIAVGHDGTDDGEVVAGNVRQEPLQLGNQKLMESGTVDCFLWAWDGGSSLANRRTRAFELLSAADTAVRADSSFAGACLYSYIDSHSTSYRQNTAGTAVVINFTIAYTART
jgi:hypothetical protein